MPKNVRAHWRIVAPLSLALFLLFSCVPATFAHTQSHSSSPQSPKYFLALGDSLAFGYQPNFDWKHGYNDDLSADLTKESGYLPVVNMACNGETSITFIHGNCPFKQIQHYHYKGSQFEAARDFLIAHQGQVGLITFDMGANDTKGYVNLQTCVTNKKLFLSALATLDRNLQIILPQLYALLIVNGKMTGQIFMMNYYDPFQNICPNTVLPTVLLNDHLASDLGNYGTMVDVFDPFGGVGTPNENICDYTWMCNKVQDIHCNNIGYQFVANIFDRAIELGDNTSRTT